MWFLKKYQKLQVSIELSQKTLMLAKNSNSA